MLQNEAIINYKESIDIICEEKNCTDIKWFVTDADFTENSDGSITINKPTRAFNVYWTAKDINGKNISASKTIYVNQEVKDKLNALSKRVCVYLSTKRNQNK